MRTTIEMKPEHRSALIAMAARRGAKGFSGVLAEAIDAFLDGERGRSLRRRELLSVAGSLSSKDVKNLRAATRAVRENWR
ncbi:MAG: hypothetical protein ACRD2S_00205 [Terriglobales bacterium]